MLLIAGGTINSTPGQLQQPSMGSDYDVDAAVTELRASGFADVDSQLNESLLEPVDAGWVTAFFEHVAGRGPDPGPPSHSSSG